MQFTINPSVVHDATVTVPGDKSVSHRALMLGSIANGTTEISGFLAGEDCLATLAAMRAMGVSIEQPTSSSTASGWTDSRRRPSRSISGTPVPRCA